MTYYSLRMTPQARAAAMVALVAELERLRRTDPSDEIGRRVRTEGMSDVQSALDALRAARPVDDPTPLRDAPLDVLQARLGALLDDMPPAAIERTVQRVHEAHERFTAAADARHERETRP